MGTRACYRDVVQEASLDIAGGAEPTQVRVLRRSKRAVRTLGSAQAKLNTFDLFASDKSHACSVRGHQGCKVNQIENWSLKQL
jgi:hypothetical protein